MDYSTTIGIDVSDKTSKICVMTKEGGKRRKILETTCETSRDGFSECSERFDRSWLVVFETGTHCRWMKEHFESMGFNTVIANPAEVKLISDSTTKNDRSDASKLARLALADVELLKPVHLRSEVYQKMLRLHKERQLLKKERTQTINQIRSFVKSIGFRLPDCSADHFHKIDLRSVSYELEQDLWPMMSVLDTIQLSLAAVDKAIEALAKTPEFKQKVERVREIYGVGIVGSTMLIAAIDGDTDRFEHARDVGPYLGLVPQSSQSGESDPQLGITKAGNQLVRKVLVECANVVLHEDAKDTDLKLKGLRIGARGGKIAKKKARAAVARNLAVLMVAMLKSPEKEYVPLSENGKKGFQLYREQQKFLSATKKSASEAI